MTTLKSLALALASALVFALPASADNTGLVVTGTLALGPNGSLGGQFWSPQTATIGGGVEYTFNDIFHEVSADFNPNHLHIQDNLFLGSTGWEMTFTTPGGFTGLSLISDTFVPGLTYSLNAGTIVVDWAGDVTPPFHTYNAIFDVTAAVPEPATYGMLLAGFGLLGFAARRKAAPRA
ncbi:MAG: sorting protein [Massilia sp.]|nr:sorting protein [Massilia sp.]